MISSQSPLRNLCGKVVIFSSFIMFSFGTLAGDGIPEIQEDASGKYMISNGERAEAFTVADTFKHILKLQSARGAYWVKPDPGFQYLLPDNATMIPEFVKDAMLSGGIDNLYWGMDDVPKGRRTISDFVRRRAGEPLNLQVSGDKKDFYVIGAGTWTGAYLQLPSLDEAFAQIDVDEAYGKEAHHDLRDWVKTRPEGLVAAKKVSDVLLVRMSELGFDPKLRWGLPNTDWGMVQIAEPGEDPFLVIEINEDTQSVYMVNTEAVARVTSKGNLVIEDRPIAYVTKQEAQDLIDAQARGQELEYPQAALDAVADGQAVRANVRPEVKDLDLLETVKEMLTKATKGEVTIEQLAASGCEKFLVN